MKTIIKSTVLYTYLISAFFLHYWLIFTKYAGNISPKRMKLKIKVGENSFRDVATEGANVLLDGQPTPYTLHSLAPNRHLLQYGLHTYEVFSSQSATGEHLFYLNGQPVTTVVKNELDQLLERLGIDQVSTTLHTDVKAPMPGKILDVRVKAGDVVTKGQTLLILEAMKMENVVKSSADGTVSQVAVSTGQTVEKNQLLVSF